MSSNATIDWILTSGAERLPKKASDWIVPAAAAAALVAGIAVVAKTAVKDESRPPMVGSWIPWIGNTWQMDKDPDTFMEEATRKYPGGVFGAIYAGNKMYFVTDPALIDRIYKQPKTFALSSIQACWARTVFSLSDKILRQTTIFQDDLAPHFDRSISPRHMMPFIEAFDQELQRIVSTMELPTESVSLSDFIIRLSYRATGYAYFGSTFDAEGSVEDYVGFDEMVWKVANGYPEYLLRRFYNCRERVIESFCQYLEKPHQASDVIAMQEQLARAHNFDRRDMGALMICSWFPTMANVPWGSVWTLIQQIQQPEGVKPILDELDKAGAEFTRTQTDASVKGPYYKNFVPFFQSTPSVPFLTSAYSETLRWTTDSYSWRGVVPDEGTVLGGYTFKKGESLVCATRLVHMDENKFKDAKKWIPTRFMAEEGGKPKDGDMKWLPFGGGVSICSGRHFAQYHARILISTLVKNFHFEIDHAKTQGPSKLSVRNRGFGVRRPEGAMFVKITRNKLE